jgi:heme-degrading monooxygenase HmoA
VEIVLFRIRTREDLDQQQYERAFEHMLERVSQVPGFVSVEGFAGEDGSELAVARFTSREAIAAWRDDPEHVRTRDRGREDFFASYEITLATVWRQYDWQRGGAVDASVAEPGSASVAEQRSAGVAEQRSAGVAEQRSAASPCPAPCRRRPERVHQSGGGGVFEQEYGATHRVVALLNPDTRAAQVLDDLWLELLRQRGLGSLEPGRLGVFAALFDALEAVGLLPAATGEPVGDVFDRDGPWQGWWSQHVPVQAWPDATTTGSRLPAALRRLPLLERITLLLDEPGGLSVDQACGVTGLPAEQHRTVLRDARLHLVAALDELADGASRAG